MPTSPYQICIGPIPGSNMRNIMVFNNVLSANDVTTLNNYWAPNILGPTKCIPPIEVPVPSVLRSESSIGGTLTVTGTSTSNSGSLTVQQKGGIDVIIGNDNISTFTNGTTNVAPLKINSSSVTIGGDLAINNKKSDFKKDVTVTGKVNGYNLYNLENLFHLVVYITLDSIVFPMASGEDNKRLMDILNNANNLAMKSDTIGNTATFKMGKPGQVIIYGCGISAIGNSGYAYGSKRITTKAADEIVTLTCP
jgi:hypothetical protein